MVDSLIRLFESTDTEFTTNGLGTLPDAVSCLVAEELNGEYELAMEYPITGKRYGELTLRRIIVAKPNPYADPQPFRIYAITKPINGIVTVNAEHISYDLSGYPVSTFTASTVNQAFVTILQKSLLSCPFSFRTDKTTEAILTVAKPSSIRSLLGGVEGSILDVYGGEYEFDGYLVYLHQHRGEDRGVTVRYGKNLTDLEQEENCSAVYTGVYPYWYSEDQGLYELPEKIVYAEGTYNFTRIHPLDLSSEFQEKPTLDQLRAAAQAYMETNNIGIPKVSLDVSFISLAQTEEYKNFAVLETVKLGDTVTVEFPELNVNSTAKCIRTIYNVITEKYDKIEIGDAKSDLASTISKQSFDINAVPTRQYIEQMMNGVSITLRQEFDVSNNQLYSYISETREYAIQYTDDQLSNYPTYEETNSAIVQSSNEILLGVSETISSTLEGYPTLEQTRSMIQQTAGKIDWLVESGTSASNFTMTPRAIQLLSESIQITAGGGGFPGTISYENVVGSDNLYVDASQFKLNSNGYYESTNKGDAYNNTFALCRVILKNVTSASTLKLKCINYAENNFDYGVIGKIDRNLSRSIDDTDSSTVYKSFKGENSPDPVEISISVPAGNHYFDIKYRKDGSQSQNNDSFQFMITGEGGGTNTISLTRDGIAFSSTTLTFTGVVTFEDLQTAGRTVINADNILTGKISAERIDTSELYAKEVRINSRTSNATVFTSAIGVNNNVDITIGVDFEGGNYEGLNKDFSFDMSILASEIAFRDNDWSNYIFIDMRRSEISVKRNNDWAIANENYLLNHVWSYRYGFSDGSYLRVASSRLRLYDTSGDYINIT